MLKLRRRETFTNKVPSKNSVSVSYDVDFEGFMLKLRRRETFTSTVPSKIAYLSVKMLTSKVPQDHVDTTRWYWT